jgi:hypothetical protein
MKTRRRLISWTEWRWTLLLAAIAVVAAALPYLLAWSQQTPERVFSGCVMLTEDCYSYLAMLRLGAVGAWLFHIPYTPEEHAGTLLYTFYLLLGKAAGLLPGDHLTTKLVVVYHLARVAFGFGLLVGVYRFLAALTQSVLTRRLAWMMVALGGGLGWLLTALGQTRWLGDVPLDLYFPEGFAFLALFGSPHVAAAQSMLLGGVLYLLRAWSTDAALGDRVPSVAEPVTATAADLPQSHSDQSTRLTSIKWAALAGLLWFLMGLIVPFYVAVAWAVAGAAWLTLCLRQHSVASIRWREALLAGLAGVISAPILVYSLYIFTSDPVYATWAAQNQILSPHPLHYVAAYGVPLILAAFAVKETWHSKGWGWVALSWVTVVPILIYLPISVQLRLTTSVQVPLSLLAARGAGQLWRRDAACPRFRRGLVLSLLAAMTPTSAFILTSSSAWMISRPSPPFRDTAEVAAMDWLAAHARPGDAVLTAYDTGAYLPARVSARVLVGHDLEATNAEKKKRLVGRFFDAASDDVWRQAFLSDYSVDYVFWGPAERDLGTFDPLTAPYLQQTYETQAYAIFTVEP